MKKEENAFPIGVENRQTRMTTCKAIKYLHEITWISRFTQVWEEDAICPPLASVHPIYPNTTWLLRGEITTSSIKERFQVNRYSLNNVKSFQSSKKETAFTIEPIKTVRYWRFFLRGYFVFCVRRTSRRKKHGNYSSVFLVLARNNDRMASLQMAMRCVVNSKHNRSDLGRSTFSLFLSSKHKDRLAWMYEGSTS